jgi:hypothetical protein
MSSPLAAQYLGISETTLRNAGPRPKNIGRRVLWDRTDLDRWADALSGQPLDGAALEAEADDATDRILKRLGLSDD